MADSRPSTGASSLYRESIGADPPVPQDSAPEPRLRHQVAPRKRTGLSGVRWPLSSRLRARARATTPTRSRRPTTPVTPSGSRSSTRTSINEIEMAIADGMVSDEAGAAISQALDGLIVAIENNPLEARPRAKTATRTTTSCAFSSTLLRRPAIRRRSVGPARRVARVGSTTRCGHRGRSSGCVPVNWRRRYRGTRTRRTPIWCWRLICLQTNPTSRS
jgi:hypothetical protein